MSFGSGYFGQMPFGGGSSEAPDLTDPADRVLALIVSLYGAAPTGPGSYPRSATFTAFTSAAAIAAFGSTAIITDRRTTATEMWKVSP